MDSIGDGIYVIRSTLSRGLFVGLEEGKLDNPITVSPLNGGRHQKVCVFFFFKKYVSKPHR
jgi:hypothetical protein